LVVSEWYKNKKDSDRALVLSTGNESIEDNIDVDFEKTEIALTNGKMFIPLDEKYIIKDYKNFKDSARFYIYIIN
jgi:hypothetical protein